MQGSDIAIVFLKCYRLEKKVYPVQSRWIFFTSPFNFHLLPPCLEVNRGDGFLWIWKVWLYRPQEKRNQKDQPAVKLDNGQVVTQCSLFNSHMLNQAIKKKIKLAFGVIDFFFLYVTKKDKWMQIIIIKYTKTHINTINHVCMVLMYPIAEYM